ncbi:MAG TPA: YceI family protein [Aquabacterium sp.]|uniref:YceI family protein n=1 Tax=Aquabacterium sp. TaxID=1872578 RepID=UPI002E30407D|nr:YceI family protein [Aquabacterium sp.]HEX5371830.1 YceI family protein [Aquabacterium sp.]
MSPMPPRPARLALLTLLMSMSVSSAMAAAPPKAPAASAPPVARLQAAGSEVSFTATQIGVPLEGRFKRFEAQIALDPRQPQTGHVSFQIDLGSVAINAETDAELLKPEWFNTGKFPKAQFVSRRIQAVGPGRYEVSGALSIKGVSRELVVPVSLTSTGAQATATGSFKLKRLDFKIGDGDWADPSVVANDVQVRFKLLLQGLPPL